jgi:hypothetical protein
MIRAFIVAVAGLTVLQQAHRVDGGPPGVLPDRVALAVQWDGRALILRWDPAAPAIRAAREGTLTITEGAHRSRLPLNGPELRSGLARYWPETPLVGFRLETDRGASGSLRATVPEASAARPVSRTEAPPPVAMAPPKARRAAHKAAAADTAVSSPPPPRPRPSRWRRLVGRIPWWRKSFAGER